MGRRKDVTKERIEKELSKVRAQLADLHKKQKDGVTDGHAVLCGISLFLPLSLGASMVKLPAYP